MHYYLYFIIAYILILLVFNFLRSKKVKSQDDMMVAGRSLSMRVMIFTLICTWIGSGTFIAGAEYAARAGWSSLWMPAGAWAGIIVIYFLAGKIRTFGQYTIGDILEVRYGKFARVFGAIALIVSFITIVSYQFKAGGLIINVITDGGITEDMGTIITAGIIILFVSLGGMMAVAYTDLPNGIIIVSACVLATPLVYISAGGWEQAVAVLPAGHFETFNPDFGEMPLLKAIGYFLATMFLLMGVQSMYQKFYSAKTPGDAKKAVFWWTIGTVVVETVVIVIAIFAATRFWPQIQDGSMNPASIVLQAARYMVNPVVGILLLAAACAVVISTGMNYLLSPTTNIMRDFYQTFINPEAETEKMVVLQKVFIVIFGA
ncbi:MAG: sodium:solute symporter family protein, partial [bacterium]|nr:sodium:solute symporter family protein [bacterium]